MTQAPARWLADRAAIPVLVAVYGTARALPLLGQEAAGGVAMLLFASTAPGLLFVRTVERGVPGGPGRRALLSVALSPGLLAAATVVPVLLGFASLSAASQVAVWGVFAGLLALWLADRRNPGPPGAAAPGEALGAVAPLAMAALALLVFVPDGNRLSYHTVLHAGITAQIHAGVVPPENPALAGEALEFYWLYHWLLAVYARLTGFSVLVSAPWIDIVSIGVYVGASYGLARRWLEPAPAALAATAVGFAGNLFFPLAWAGAGAVRGFGEGPPFWPMNWIHVGWLGGDPRVVTLLAKFFATGGFPLGLALWAVLLNEMVPDRQRRPDEGVAGGHYRPGRAVLFAGLCSVILFHATTALGVLVALSLGHLSQSFDGLRGLSLARLWRENARMAGVFLAALAATGPYLLAIASGSQAASLFSAPDPAVIFYNLQGLVLSATPLLPVVVAAALLGWSDRSVRFLSVATAAALGLATVLSLPDSNQYKLLLVAFLPGGALLFWLLSDRSGLGAPRLRRAAGVAALGLVLLAHAVTVGAHFAAQSSQRDDHRGDGGYLAWPGNPPADQALRWIRDHTPHDAVVISRPVRFGSSHVAAVSGRGPFVLVGGHHTEGQLEYVLRMRLVQRLFSGQGLLSSQVAHLRAALDRPLYVLLLRDEHPERFEDHQRRFRATFDEVFRRDDVSVYAVGREGGAP